MISKKNTIKIISSLSLLALPGLFISNNKVVKADSDVETASYADMVIRTAINEGEMYSGKYVDYSIVHGNVASKNINKFTTFTSDSSAWTGTLGQTSDNAYATNYQICTLLNDGVIAKITAKDNVEVNISRNARKGWEDPCVLGVYKENSLGTTLLKETNIESGTDVSEFCGTYDLLKGETLYYEFRMPYDGSHRNMQELSSIQFTFTQKEIAPVAQEVSANWAKILENVNSVNGDYYQSSIVDYTVKHGNVKNNVIDNFTSYSATSFTVDNGASASNWQNVAVKNDGVIFAVKANKYVELEYGVAHFNTGATSDTLNGWVGDANINIYKMTSNGLETIKEKTLVANNPTSDVSGKVVLETGEILYYEFNFQWDTRNMQNYLPTFKAVEIMHNMSHVHAHEATCKEQGNVDYYYCDECNKYFSDAKGENEILEENVFIAKKNHTEVIDEAVEATCTSTGLTEGKHCSECNEVLVAQEVTPKLAHTEVIDEAVEATCTSTGLTEGKHCSECNEVLVAQEVTPKLDHAFGEWKVTKEPTATEPGEEERVCSNCNEKETRTIDPIGKPSEEPSVEPSEQPSEQPSVEPSVTPSETPSEKPSETISENTSTSEENPEEPKPNKKGCKGSAMGGMISFIALAGSLLLRKRK